MDSLPSGPSCLSFYYFLSQKSIISLQFHLIIKLNFILYYQFISAICESLSFSFLTPQPRPGVSFLSFKGAHHQLTPFCFKPLFAFLIIRHIIFHKMPKARRVVHLYPVAKLVDNNIVLYLFWSEH